MSLLRCPGCHAIVHVHDSKIRRHHEPNAYRTVTEDKPLEVYFECKWSGARVGVV
jgi:hypothetical protein